MSEEAEPTTGDINERTTPVPTCVITGTRNVECAHLVARATKSHKLTVLEYCFGFEHNTFNIHTRSNILYLGRNLHSDFDCLYNVLLPELDVLERSRNFIQSVLAWRDLDKMSATSTRAHALPISAFQELGAPHLHNKEVHEFTLIPLNREIRDPILDVGTEVVFTYPYRGLPAISSHIAPLYAVWNAGPKLTVKGMPDIPNIARHFCEFVKPSPAPPPAQPERVKDIESRLELVAEIWKMIMAVETDAASWGKGGKKRKRVEDLDSNAPSSSIRTSIPSTRVSARLFTRMFTRAASSTAASALHGRPKTRSTRSHNTTTPGPAKSRKISSADRPKGKGRNENKGDNLRGAGVEEETPPVFLTSKTLRAHNNLLHAHSNDSGDSLRFIQRWIANSQYTGSVDRERMSSEVEYAPTDKKLAKPSSLAGIVERAPAECAVFPN